MTVVLWVSSQVLEGEGGRGGNNEHLQHEIVQCLQEDLAEGLNLKRLTVVVAKMRRPGDEICACEALINIDFKLVTDVLDTCTKENIS